MLAWQILPTRFINFARISSDPALMGAESTLEDPGFLNPSEFERVMRQQLDLYVQVRCPRHSTSNCA